MSCTRCGTSKGQVEPYDVVPVGGGDRVGEIGLCRPCEVFVASASASQSIQIRIRKGTRRPPDRRPPARPC